MLNRVDYKPVPFHSIREMLDLAVADCPDRDAYQFTRGDSDEIIHVTFREFYEITENLGAALTELGYGDAHVACLSENSFEWICAYVTVLKSAGVFIPVDGELLPKDKLHVLTESDATVMFVSKKHEKWVRENRDSLPAVKCIILFGAEEDDGDFISYRRLLEHGAGLDRDAYDALHSDEYDMKYLVYTSGTTGIAKGVMLTEHNLVSCVYYGLHVSQIYDKGLSVLPYHHTYESVTDILVSLHYHSTLCLNSSLRRIVKDLQRYQPSYVYIVPALAEFMYSSIMKNIKQQGKEKSFSKAVNLSRKLRKFGIDLRPVIFKSLRDVFGGRLIKIVCGGAPIRPEIGEFFNDIGIYLVGGYGITECSPLVSVNHERTITYDTVGKRLPCLEWRIDSPNEEGIGEICVKGDTVMKGYYKQPEKTAEVIRDGWFYTGDYGYIDAEDQLVITGRKKNIIVLNNGKNVYPEEIEGYIQGIPYIEEVVVQGLKNDMGDEYSLLAEVFLGEGGEGKSEQEILSDIDASLSGLPNYKRVTKVVIREEPFPKTSTNKIKRSY
ncbi:MAG: AMP-binding protein [Oscillospiraceae bacterium]|nr:AMP-binding protein [Oscillospiraceae bacterium]